MSLQIALARHDSIAEGDINSKGWRRDDEVEQLMRKKSRSRQLEKKKHRHERNGDEEGRKTKGDGKKRRNEEKKRTEGKLESKDKRR